MTAGGAMSRRGVVARIVTGPHDATCSSRIRCQAATGSWTKSRQWETQRTLFRSARATMRPPTKVNGVWPFNDAWLRTSLSEAWKSASVRSRSRAWQNSTGSRHSRRVVPIRRPAGCGRRCGGNRGGSGSARRSPDKRCATPCASGGWGCRCGGRPTANRPLIDRLVGVHRSFIGCEGARQRFTQVAEPFADTFLLGDVTVTYGVVA